MQAVEATGLQPGRAGIDAGILKMLDWYYHQMKSDWEMRDSDSSETILRVHYAQVSRQLEEPGTRCCWSRKRRHRPHYQNWIVSASRGSNCPDPALLAAHIVQVAHGHNVVDYRSRGKTLRRR